jgi:hypothetical protein
MARKNESLAGRDTFHVVGPPGFEIVKGAAAHALNRAQRFLEVSMNRPFTLYVERRSVIGPSAKLYRVDRLKDGSVVTTTIESVD